MVLSVSFFSSPFLFLFSLYDYFECGGGDQAGFLSYSATPGVVRCILPRCDVSSRVCGHHPNAPVPKQFLFFVLFLRCQLGVQRLLQRLYVFLLI